MLVQKKWHFSVTISLCLEKKRYKIGSWLLWNVNRNSWVLDRSLSVLMILSNFKSRWYTRNPLFSNGSPCIHSYRLTNSDQIWHGNSHGNPRGEGHVCKESSTPPSQGTEPQAPQFGVPSYLCLLPFTENDQFRRGSTHGKGEPK